VPDYAPVYGRPRTATFLAGATIIGGQVLYFSAADTVSPATAPGQPFAGVSGGHANPGDRVTVLMGILVHEHAVPAQLGAPAAPVPTTAATGGTVADGTYRVTVTYTTPAGETTASAQGQVTAAGGGTSTLTIPSPAAAPGATGWYAYVSQAGGSTLTRQQAPGSPTAIGTGLTLTAPPSSGGAQAPGASTSGIAAGQLVATAATGTVGQAGAGQGIGVAVRASPVAGGLLRWKTIQ
jgi:hypothetical protein